MTALLAVEGVSVAFGGVQALSRVSMEIEAGSCCGIIGPNGSGKTTLLGVISRLTGLDSGRLLFAGTDFTRMSPARTARLGIARTFQAVRLLPTLTVRKNVMVGAAARTAARGPLLNFLDLPRALLDEREAGAAADRALDRVGLRAHASAWPQDLPYGLQRRVEIARALATSPRLLLLDEPMAGMSHAERLAIASILQELRAGGMTEVLVEHDLGMIHRVCDTAYALDFGQVIAAGPPREVAEQPAVREAYIGHQAEVEAEARS